MRGIVFAYIVFILCVIGLGVMVLHKHYLGSGIDNDSSEFSIMPLSSYPLMRLIEYEGERYLVNDNGGIIKHEPKSEVGVD